MDKFSYKNILGSFIFKGDKIISYIPNEKNGRNENPADKKLAASDPGFVFPKNEEFKELFYSLNMKQTEFDIRNSIKQDHLLSQAVNSIDELNKVINLLSKRLREWYGFYFPELGNFIEDNEAYAKLILEKDRDRMCKEFNVKTIGSEMNKEDITQIKELASYIITLSALREKQKNYIDHLMNRLCPNLREVATSIIGAELISHAGSLGKLAEMTSSTIQLLGAEKALFRHLKNKNSRCPKHGIIINHPLIASAPMSKKGKASRHLSSAIAMAAKIDFFHKEGKLDNKEGIRLVEKVKAQL